MSDFILPADILQNIFREAFDQNASDIHIDPTPTHTRVQFRIDGILVQKENVSRHIHHQIILKIKILARLRTDEHKHAQDGRCKITISETSSVEMRISIVPTFYGENAVIRLLRETYAAQDLLGLGFDQDNVAKILKAIQKHHGMILVTGPTGSGKTTTLYTILRLLNNSEKSIITLEDPVEYTLPGIRQVQVTPYLTFSHGLRALVRQDPDIIMVGEIRDTDTAHIATHTALTGHLLLSTVHTNNAATTLPRLLDMGIDPYLIASTVELVIAQRLIRKRNKNRNGYIGRVGIYEVLVITDEIRQAIMLRKSSSEIEKIARDQGMKTMKERGLKLVESGITTHEELLRTIYE